MNKDSVTKSDVIIRGRNVQLDTNSPNMNIKNENNSSNSNKDSPDLIHMDETSPDKHANRLLSFDPLIKERYMMSKHMYACVYVYTYTCERICIDI
jgi:hypothetical protein